MGYERDYGDYKPVECRHAEIEVPFSYKMADGTIFRIDTQAVRRHDILTRQLRTQETVELKGCLRPDPNFEDSEIDGIEQWQIIFFTAYKGRGRNKEEVSHGTIVPYEDSAVNVNLTIRRGVVIRSSSNHKSESKYEELQTPIALFAENLVQKMLDDKM